MSTPLTPGVVFVLVAWVVALVLLFRRLTPARAIIASFVVGWLLLPETQVRIVGIPDLTKLFAVCGGVAVAALLFEREKMWRLGPRGYDLPMAIWCASPFAASLSNGLGAYDGLSAAFARALAWGVPYVLGRRYLCDRTGLRDLAIGIFAGGLLYVPLCWFEIAAGPQLHDLLYGYTQEELVHAQRFGGWRPLVFLQSGLMVGFWMVAATLCCGWLWASRGRTRVAGVHLGWGAALLATAVWVKSVSAWIHLAVGFALLASARARGSWLLILCLCGLVVGFVGVRASGVWSGEGLPVWIERGVNAERASSVAFRLENENLMSKKIRERALLGWGRWGRYRVFNESIGAETVVDSLWIKAFGETGWVGLSSVFAAILLPVLLFWQRSQGVPLAREPALVLVVLLALYALDGSMNAMVNPILMLAAGGLSGYDPRA